MCVHKPLINKQIQRLSFNVIQCHLSLYKEMQNWTNYSQKYFNRLNIQMFIFR